MLGPCLTRALKCHFTDATIDLLRINCVYSTLALSSRIVSGDNIYREVMFNFSNTELCPSNPGLVSKIKSHGTGCEVGGQSLGGVFRRGKKHSEIQTALKNKSKDMTMQL